MPTPGTDEPSPRRPRPEPPGTDSAVEPPRPGERVLITRLRYAGDAILSLPLVAALGRALPEVELHYLAEPATLEVLEAQPEIDHRWTAGRGIGRTVALARRLRAQRFAAAIDLFCNPRSALLVLSSGARVRVGEARRVRRHAYTLARRLVPGLSALEQHLDAMRGLGLVPPPAERPVLRLRDAEREAGAARWRALASTPGVLVHLGATQPAKEWPVEHAARLVARLAAEGLPVALSTAPLRPEPSRRVADLAGRAASLLPPLPLREVLGIVSAAAAVVTVDGAIAHAAVALGRPTLALFGPTEPDVWFPYASFGPFRVLHAGGDRPHQDLEPEVGSRSLAALAPEDVLQALRALLATVSPNAGGGA